MTRLLLIALLGMGATVAAQPATTATPATGARTDCFYCTRNQELADLMIEVCKLPHSTVYLFRNQFFTGRCVVAYNQGHPRELYDLTPAERAGFMDEVAQVAAALDRLFHPDKINYAIFGDKVDHLHFHVVPKYRDNSEWGKPFPVNPDAKKTLSEAGYAELIARLKRELTVPAAAGP